MSKATSRLLRAKLELARVNLEVALAYAELANEHATEVKTLQAENERLEEELGLLKECHDDHYQGYLAMCKENGRLLEALSNAVSAMVDLGAPSTLCELVEARAILEETEALASGAIVRAVIAVAGAGRELGVFTERALVEAAEGDERLEYDLHAKVLYYKGPLEGIQGAKDMLGDLGSGKEG